MTTATSTFENAWTKEEYAEMAWGWVREYVEEMDGDDLSDAEKLLSMAGFIEQAVSTLGSCKR